MPPLMRTPLTIITVCIVFLSLLFSSTVRATTTPVLTCVTVNPNGSVTVTWDPVTTTAGFNYYQIITSSYSILGTISNINTGTYTINSINTNAYVYNISVAASYYITTLNYSNFICTPLLTVSGDATTNPGTADLTWYGSTLVPGNYDVYSSYNSGTLTYIGSSITNTYSQSITDCNVPIQYQLQIQGPNGCISKSNIVSGVFSKLGNIIDKPDLRCTSVLPNGNVELNWLIPSGSGTDFNEYAIYRDNILIDSVSTFNQNTYVDTSINANLFYHNYYLKSKSGCSGQITSTATNTMATMYLVTASPAPNSCAQTWTALPLSNTAAFYQVNRTIGSNTNVLQNTVSLNYIDLNIPAPSVPQYQITVQDQSGCASHSNFSSGCTVTGIAAQESSCNIQQRFNHTNHEMEISSDCIHADAITVSLYNSVGQLIGIENSKRNSDNNYIFRIKSQIKGIVFYSIISEDKKFNGKLILN